MSHKRKGNRTCPYSSFDFLTQPQKDIGNSQRNLAKSQSIHINYDKPP
uniref:Uncharacterized protein n=1 Tax=Rhizophora mucronata TaxID=61149 RepID=A0A2P2NYW2_RHIMU